MVWEQGAGGKGKETRSKSNGGPYRPQKRLVFTERTASRGVSREVIRLLRLIKKSHLSCEVQLTGALL